jgi:hypothetical protein
MSVGALPTEGRTGSRWVAIVALVAVAAGSGLGGAAVDRAVVRRSVRIVGDTGFHPLSSALRSPSAADRQQYRTELSAALSLTPDQNRIIDSILDSRAGQFEALRESIRPRVDGLVADVRGDVERVLTPLQRDRYRELQHRAGSPTSDTASR